jgi:hypothetical protein
MTTLLQVQPLLDTWQPAGWEEFVGAGAEPWGKSIGDECLVDAAVSELGAALSGDMLHDDVEFAVEVLDIGLKSIESAVHGTL